MLYLILNICWTNTFTYEKSQSQKCQETCPRSHWCRKFKITQLCVKSMQFSFFSDIWSCFHLTKTSALFLFLILLLSSQSLWSAKGPEWLPHLPRSFPICPRGEFCPGIIVCRCCLQWCYYGGSFPWGIMHFRGQGCCSWLCTASC